MNQKILDQQFIEIFNRKIDENTELTCGDLKHAINEQKRKCYTWTRRDTLCALVGGLIIGGLVIIFILL